MFAEYIDKLLSGEGNYSIYINLTEEIEECIEGYIPTTSESRKALGTYGLAFTIIGSITTVVLYAMFFEQIIFTVKNINKVYRRHIIWITSVYPFMTFMTTLAFIMPRASTIISGIQAVYMCIGISHFINLTELMFGSEKVMLYSLKDEKFIIATGPTCCCCPCLPTPEVTRKRLRIIRWMVMQMPYLQAVYFLAAILWNIAESDENGLMNPNKGYISVQAINLLSFMCGVWALNIMSSTVKDKLEYYGYAKKSFLMKTCILVTRFQGFVLDCLGLFDIYPCLGPPINPTVFKIVLEQSMYLVEMIFLGPLTYWQFRDLSFITKNPSEVPVLPSYNKNPSIIPVSSEFPANPGGVSIIARLSLDAENGSGPVIGYPFDQSEKSFQSQSQRSSSLLIEREGLKSVY